MAQSTVTPITPRTRKSNPIFVDPASIEELKGRTKNVTMNFGVHPELAAKVYETIASDPESVVQVGDKAELKRTKLTASLRQLLANSVGYTGDLNLIGRRGGNVVGMVTLFQSSVRAMFEMSRTMASQFNLPEEQVKGMAFANAKQSVAANPQLANIEVSDEVLEAIWSGQDIEADDDDDDDDDDE